MKKLPFAALLAVLAVSLLFLSGCLKDSCSKKYTIKTPVFRKLSEVRSEMRSGPARPIKNSGKIYIYGKYLFINEPNEGLHVLDNSNPSNPVNMSFISIPGNVDLAVKGGFLFVDCYSDIIVMDLSDPRQVKPVKFLDNAIPENGYFWGNATDASEVEVITGYTSKDTTVDCETYNAWMNCATCNMNFAATAASSPTGKGGSMARFTIVNDYLYGVSSYQLYAFNISDPRNLQLKHSQAVTGGVETIYPFSDKLFIGSVSGMFIYDIAQPSQPSRIGQFQHMRSCDPVITDGSRAYVTLRSGNACAGNSNQMDVLNISNLSAPSLIKTYPMSNPHGLAKDGNLLFVCDGDAGLKIYDAKNDSDIKLVKTIGQKKTFDVITNNGIALVIGGEGLLQYDYSNPSNIRLLSRIAVTK